MKKLFFLATMALFTFVFVIANNVITNSPESVKEVQETGDVSTYATIAIDGSSITLPYTITVPAPPLGTIVNVAGPCNENMTNWSVQNGELRITYTEAHDILCLQDPDCYYIETPTIYNGSIIKYKIKIIAR